MESGVATRPIADMEAYRERLSELRLPRPARAMKPVFEAPPKRRQARRSTPKARTTRVLRAVQMVVDERLARPVLVGPDRGDRRAASRSWVCGSSRAGTSNWSTLDDDAMIGDAAEEYYQLHAAQGRLARA